ncbi:splicing factor 3A subunit 3-like [Daphnia carinata]|uniref:splicing factor 3A subunit 3-like n=1 Tax=Daphnia carinata TaxID=120202 RepID=UPI00257F6BC4|nr:splicing factor 3A subunit 3-like [Daphnia carinata]
METLLEQQRRYHEEKERIVDSMVKETIFKKTTQREIINSEHRQKILLDRYMESTRLLKEIYEDKDGQRKEEVALLSGPNEFVEFYNRLKQIKEFYKKHPNEIAVPMSMEFDEFAKQRESGADETNNLVDFTDEEGYGKYLDLHESYTRYINLKGIQKVDYINYLNIFDRLFDIPRDKKNGEYRNYLQGLVDYLVDYVARVKPVMDLDNLFREIEQDFEKDYTAGTFPGWPKETTGSALANTGAPLDVSAFSSWEELASLGLDRLKSALMALGLKCGGTLEDRAKRLFSTKGLQVDEIDKSLFAKGQGKNRGTTEQDKEVEKHKKIALLEAQVYKLVEILSEPRHATKENVERKQARTDGEREEEEEDVIEVPEDEDDDDDVPYNPKNLPLGWDGKPIPYWLYKLHGLNISYNCEICGNYTYKGPKAFQRHFAEWRHAHGMRCLGIPNTAHFANVTRIEDAISLWTKLRSQKTSERFVADHEEEYEDSMGNVIPKKTYEDLRRQGLL